METLLRFAIGTATLILTFGGSFVLLARAFRPAPPPEIPLTWEQQRAKFAKEYPVQTHPEIQDAWTHMESLRKRRNHLPEVPYDITIVKL
ncbi:MAG: hypothetical protein ABSE51_20005 [Terracidiphilus sp.]